MVTLWVFQQGILLTLTVLTSAKEADNSVWFMPCCQLILSCAFLPSFLDAGWIGRAKNTTKPTRKRYTFAPIYRSLKTSFKAIFCADPESILFDIFHPGAKIHFSDFIKAKREKKGKIYFPSVFSTGKQIVFFCSVHYEIWAAFDTLQLMHTKPFVFWYGNQICGVFISSEPISNKSGACQLSFPLFYTGQIGIPAVSNVRITKLEFFISAAWRTRDQYHLWADAKWTASERVFSVYKDQFRRLWGRPWSSWTRKTLLRSIHKNGPFFTSIKNENIHLVCFIFVKKARLPSCSRHDVLKQIADSFIFFLQYSFNIWWNMEA